MPGDPLRFLFAGTWLPHKGLDLLVRALAGFDPARWSLSVAGAGVAGADGTGLGAGVAGLAGVAAGFSGRGAATAGVLAGTLASFFGLVEIVSDKTASTYERIFSRHGDGPQRAVMVGNSLKSDILPVIALGGFFFFMIQSAQGGGRVARFGRARARLGEGEVTPQRTSVRGFAHQRHYLIRGSSLNWWNGGGEGSVHSSVFALGPHGLSPALRLATNISMTTTRNQRVAAAEMQERIRTLAPKERVRLAIRVGFHYGPAIDVGNDIFGDSENRSV